VIDYLFIPVETMFSVTKSKGKQLH